jgi:chromosome segregation ATPase
MYTVAVPSAAALEEEVQAARSRHRERMEGLARLSADQLALREASSEAKNPWQSLRDWLARLPLLSGLLQQAPQATQLEDRIEVAQRRVLELAHHLDRLAADRASLTRQLGQLQQRISTYEANADIAAQAILALEQQLEATHPAQAQGALLEAQVVQHMAEMRAFQRAAQRLGALCHLHQEFLQLDESVEGRLSQLHSAGTEMLDALDRQLAVLLDRERARQLQATVGHDLVSLRDSVARVNRLAAEGAVLLTEDLDRLADEVDLLAPSDAEARAAEQELAVFLRDRTVEQAVARARQQVALRARARGHAD